MNNTALTRVLLFACAVILLPSGALPAEAREPVQVAEAFISALSQRDADGALQLLDEKAVLEMPFPLAAGENKYGTRKMWGAPLRTYLNGIMQRNSSIAFKNKVWYSSSDGVVFLECDGDMVRSSDGQRYQNSYIVLFKVEKDKIVLWREYFNPVVAARTFGISLESLPWQP